MPEKLMDGIQYQMYQGRDLTWQSLLKSIFSRQGRQSSCDNGAVLPPWVQLAEKVFECLLPKKYNETETMLVTLSFQ